MNYCLFLKLTISWSKRFEVTIRTIKQVSSFYILFRPVSKFLRRRRNIFWINSWTRKAFWQHNWGAYLKISKISKRLCDCSFWKLSTWLYTESKVGRKIKRSSSLSLQGMLILKTFLIGNVQYAHNHLQEVWNLSSTTCSDQPRF